MKYALPLAFVAALTPLAALAGPQYLDETGYAVSGFDVVAYRSLPQSPLGQDQPQAIAGHAAITAEYNGATFAFASEANRDAFVANPAYYAPQYDGHCAYGIYKGGKVPGHPHLWRIVDDKLYLNITRTVVGFWESDIPGHITGGDINWGRLEPNKASTSTIPRYTSPAPEKG